MHINYEITNDHIGIFDNFYDNSLLEKYVEYFEFYSKNIKTYHRNNININDECFDVITKNYYETLEVGLNYLTNDFVRIFFEKIYPLYVEKYQALTSLQKHFIFDAKVQKTKPGQGYHIWHCENDGFHSRNRICAFMIYLNDVDDGGETEFLHQKKRIKPKKNRLLLWPSYFTHTHRGNPPISGEKYILTGWVEYC